MADEGLIPKLKSFQVAQLAYDMTLAKAFAEEGGFTERPYRVRSGRRREQ